MDGNLVSENILFAVKMERSKDLNGEIVRHKQLYEK